MTLMAREPRCRSLHLATAGCRADGGVRWGCRFGRGDVDSGGGNEQAAAESDGAEREPCPAEREAADHVREPMQVEQGATRGDGGRERDCDCDQQMPRAAAKFRPMTSAAAA